MEKYDRRKGGLLLIDSKKTFEFYIKQYLESEYTVICDIDNIEVTDDFMLKVTGVFRNDDMQDEDEDEDIELIEEYLVDIGFDGEGEEEEIYNYYKKGL